MNYNQNTSSQAGRTSPTDRVTLVSVDEPQTTETGKAYVPAFFKKGVFGRAIRRSFWARPDEEGTLKWDRATPEELKAIVGQDVSGMIDIVPVEINPKDIIDTKTGETKTIQNATIVKLADETLDQAARSYGVVIREQPRVEPAEIRPLPVPGVAAGFKVVGVNGKQDP